MDPSLDDFLNFQNSNAEPLKIDFSAFDFGLEHTDSNDNDLFRNVPVYNSKSIQNMLDQDNQQNNLTDMFNFDTFQANNAQQFELDNNQNNQVYERCSSFDQTESTCSPNGNDNDQTLANGSKKITKREKAKLKAKAKQDALEELLETVDKKYIPEGFYDPNLDAQTRKKMIQVIRNRVSAQTSRDKKKALVNQIVDVKSTLEQRNQDLEKQNEYLTQQLLSSQAHCRSLQEQIEVLKKSSTCLKCGPTSDFGTNETMETTEDSASYGNSNPPSPLLYRAGGVRGKMFGFGAAFTTLMCFIMFMNMNMNSIPQAGRAGVKTHLVQKVRNLGGVCPKNATVEKILYKEKETNLEDSQVSGDIKLETIKSLVDTFENFNEKVYKAFESSQLVVDLSNRKFEHEEKPSKITKTSFLGKNATTKAAKVNQTSTIFINSGIEFSKNDSNKPLSTQTNFQEEVVGTDGMLQKDTDLDLGKADYVQLFVPKSSMGQLNNNKLNGAFGNLPTLQDEEEDETMLEVWCKVFAVRETSATL